MTTGTSDRMLTGGIYGEKRFLIEGDIHLRLTYLGYATCVPERAPLIRRRGDESRSKICILCSLR